MNINTETSVKSSSNTVLVVVVLVLVIVIGVGGYLFYMKQGEDVSLVPVNDSGMPNNQGVGSRVNTLSTEGEKVKPDCSSPAGKIKGEIVGSLFIPSSFSSEDLEYLKSLQSKGQLPIEVDETTLGKTNPFLK